MLVAIIAVAGVGTGGYAVYTVHAENAALKEQVQQMNQIALVLTEEQFSLVQEGTV